MAPTASAPVRPAQLRSSNDLRRWSRNDPAPYVLPSGERLTSGESLMRQLEADAAAGGHSGAGGRYAPRPELSPAAHGWLLRPLDVARDAWDSGDVWGSAMAALGGIADVLAVLAPGYIPAAWQYRAGMGLDVDSLAYREDTGEGWHTSAVLSVLGVDPAHPRQLSELEAWELRRSGDVLDRIISAAVAAGLDY